MSNALKLASALGGTLPLPTFVSSSSITGGGGATTTLSLPAGVQNGDLLICGTYNVAGSTQTLPTGFTALSELTNGTPGSFALSTKIASGEPASYTVEVGSGTRVGFMLAYRNATRVNTVGVLSAITGSTSSWSAPSISPTYTGTLLALYVQESNANLSTPPAGMTQRLVETNTPIVAAYDVLVNSGATGDKTIVWGTSVVGVCIQLQITNEPPVAPEFVASASTQTPANSGTLTINKPAGTVEGDLMVAVMASNADGPVWSGDTGWTEVADQAGNCCLRVAYKVAGASEGSAYSFTASKSTQSLSGAILTYRYAAYDTIGSFTSGTNPLILPSISPSESQSVLIAAGARAGVSLTLGTPTGMTARVTDNDVIAPSYIICDQTVAKGPTGTRSMSAAGSTNNGGLLLSIKPTRSL